ncbi:hypothetical protein [Actinomadura sp. NEAU-AAG7]|uniref:hypothetical protein n=1 Tax=Actinomadura sp. NEAU-AAG7 TaxID=2839640 RepID=UPI001BE41C8E|nr:hypothetical protein [Actinomadura sp. NEAU-AAG7]MBT2207899.1 hypothetical protein [Actinomadura sp. NEAU-AAG7]
MAKKIAIVLAFGGLMLGATACDDDGGDGKGDAKAGPSTPSAAATPGATAPGAAAPTSPSAASPTAASPTPSTPAAAPARPRLPTSKTIVMIDPDGKRYTYTEMAQLAAGMRATMKTAPSNFCAKSYQEGVKGGGRFPAGRGAWMSACEEGWRLGAKPRWPTPR